MQIVPAIDILEGKVVRLYQGDYEKVSYYNFDHLHFARIFAELGYSHLHIIDLLGSKMGSPKILKEIESLLLLGFELQVGGGIRNLKSAHTYLDIGAKYIIIGTQALIQPTFIDELFDTFGPEPIIVSLDVRNGKLSMQGWLQEYNYSIEYVLKQLVKQGVKKVIITDITRDGTLAGIDIELYKPLVQEFSIKIYAAGGITSNIDIEKLENIGIPGAIIGKAIYEKSPNDFIKAKKL